MQDNTTISPAQAMTNASDGCSPENKLGWPSKSDQPLTSSESRVLTSSTQ